LKSFGGNVPLSPIYVTFNPVSRMAVLVPGSAPSPTLRKRTTSRSRSRSAPDILRCGWCRSTTTPIFPRCAIGRQRARRRCSPPGWRP
jgi:hypothetical protein